MNWEIVIGLETHAQLSTRSKIFSGASTAFGAAPNTQASRGRHRAAGRAAGAEPRRGRARDPLRPRGRRRRSTAARSSRARTTSIPTCRRATRSASTRCRSSQGGAIDDPRRRAREKTRAPHARAPRGGRGQVAARRLPRHDRHRPQPRRHAAARDRVRARHALAPQEAVAYARSAARAGALDRHLRRQHAGRLVPLRRQRLGAPRGRDKLGTRCEIKNLNSFRFMEQAIEFEVRRQIELIEDGGTVVQETRLYDPDRDETRADAQQGRRARLPLLPGPGPAAARGHRGVDREVDARAAGAAAGEARALRERVRAARPRRRACSPSSREMAELLRAAVAGAPAAPRRRSSSRTGSPATLTRALNDAGTRHRATPSLGRAQLATAASQRIARRHDLAARSRRTCSTRCGPARATPTRSSRSAGLRQISDAGALEKIVDEVLAANPKQVADYRAGKEKAFNSLVGKVMKATKGKANPAQVNEILKRKLAGG